MSIRRPAAALVICAAGSIVSVPGALGMPACAGVSVRPAHFDPAVPATRAYFIRSVAPGGSFSEAVVVSDGNARPVHLLVYPADGLTGVTSGTVYANRQDPRRQASTWIRMVSGTIVVPAHGSVSVPFTAHVPRHAISGDHVAGIALESAASVRSRGRFSVRLGARPAVRRLDIGDRAER